MRLEDAVELQPAKGVANVRAADAELRGEIALGGQPIAGLQRARRNQVAQLLEDQL